MNLQQKKEMLIELEIFVDKNWLDGQFEWCMVRIRRNMVCFGLDFPSACAANGKHRTKKNDDWANGFWTGMFWLSYEWTKEEKFLVRTMENIHNFRKHLDQHFILDHHDIGFLYSLPTGAGHKVVDSQLYKELFLQAVNILVARFQNEENFIQAWRAYDDPLECRLIIDSLINPPSLFQACALSNDPHYKKVAFKHYQTLLHTVIREDATTFHTYYSGSSTRVPTHGVTHQGHSDESTWAKGQSWMTLRIPLNKRYLHSAPFLLSYKAIADVFLEHSPQDFVPHWDFDFNGDFPSDKNSSSLAIAVYRLLETEKMEAYPEAKEIVKGMIYQLGTHYTAKNDPEGEEILLHDVYAHAEGKGVDESNLWGDYFYLGAFMRPAKPEWSTYW